MVLFLFDTIHAAIPHSCVERTCREEHIVAHLFAPQPGLTELPVFFNVDGVVGAPPAQNKREDVLLVQFIFETIAKNPVATTGPEVLAAAKAVQVTGNVDAATVNAIT